MVVVMVPAVAMAGARDEAEHTRLSEEMSRFASRNAWRGVENSYQKMLGLQRKGVTLTFQDHYLGAQAASNLGDITATYQRAVLAAEVAQNQEETDQAQGWVADIEANYGPVNLVVPARYSENVTFEIGTMPFNPEHRAVYQLARAQVMEGSNYQGLLPVGEYTFGENAFQIAANSDFAEPIRVSFATEAPSSGALLAYSGPRVDLGGGLAGAGASSNPSEPGAFQGAGLRAGLGWEVGLRSGLGLLVQIGGHTIHAGEGEDPSGVEVPGTGLTVSEAYGVSATSSSMQAGYGWMALGYRPTPWLGLNVGPIYSLGRATAQGTSDAGDLSQYAEVNGSIRAGGGALGVTYLSPVRLGPLGLGVSALGGAQSDASRWYTWGQVALTFTPSGSNG